MGGNGRVHDLTIIDSYILCQYTGGLIAGTITGKATISRCYVEGRMTGYCQYAGLLVGSSNATIEYCYSSGYNDGQSAHMSGLSLPIDVEAEKVVYDREVTGESTTICLPYDLPVPENTTAYVLDNTDSYGITLEKYEGVLEANQPYVLMMKETANARRRGGDDTSSVINLGASNVTISHSAEEGSVVKNNFTLCGTLHSMTHEEGLEKKAYIMLPDNSWRMTASSYPAMAKEQYLAPFQAYLLYTGVGELEEVSTSFDSSTTDVQTARQNITQSSKDGWYDMNGRKLNGKPTRKGAYLHQGKVIIL